MLYVAEIQYEWARVAEAIAREITEGKLQPGALLRGERAMAEEHGVAIGTIRRTMRDLRERGLVVTLPHKGTYVAQQQ